MEAQAAAQEALDIAVPLAEGLPQTFSPLTQEIAKTYREACKAASAEADAALLKRVLLAAEEAMPAEQRQLHAAIRTAVENAHETGTLDEEALAALPPEAADELRAAWAALQSAMAETGPAEPPAWTPLKAKRWNLRPPANSCENDAVRILERPHINAAVILAAANGRQTKQCERIKLLARFLRPSPFVRLSGSASNQTKNQGTSRLLAMLWKAREDYRNHPYFQRVEHVH